jgi:hypothetical protein
VTKRLEFPPKVYKAIVLRANGKCELCGAVLKKGEAEVNHKDMDAMVVEKRKLTIDDGECLCKPCHREITNKQLTALAKAKRNEAKHIGAVKPKGRQKPVKEQRTAKAGLPPRRLYQ